MRGRLILVVGPSGVGKDSIIAGAAECCRDDARIIFARRFITRPAAAGGEDHAAVTPGEFAAMRDSGGLMLHWQAHGLEYGLPASLGDQLARGRLVVANVSRTVVTEARRNFPTTIVVAILASPETLALRLAARGRETADGIKRRLGRAASLGPVEADIVIDNDGPLAAAVGSFVALLREAASHPSG